jgi:hypothetical protein
MRPVSVESPGNDGFRYEPARTPPDDTTESLHEQIQQAILDQAAVWEEGAMRAVGVADAATVAARTVAPELERLRAELAEIKRVTEPPTDEEMPTDPAELREMWEFINRQARWQWHMAHKFGEQVERLRAQLERRSESHLFWRKFAVKLEAERDDARDERDALRHEVEQWQATYGETALRDARKIITERDALKAATKKIHEAARRLQEAESPGVAAFWSHELLKLTLALAATESHEAKPCPRCDGSRFEPGTETEGDWDSAAMRHHPYTGEPCSACNGTGKAPESNAPARTPVTAGAEAHGEAGEAQEARE